MTQETTQVVQYVSDSEMTLSVDQIKANRSKIVNVMESVMKKQIHYGTIPGADKPTIFKPGCEVLLSTFRIAIDPVVTDMSTTDEIKYRVECRGISMATGVALGAGIGECSSSEEKYKWRKAVCKEEFSATPDDRRRQKWARGKTGPYQVDQVRTNPSDIANTVLKMAKKRALADFVLTVLAASEIFSQDLEDLPEEIREIITDQQPVVTVQQPVRKSETVQAKPAPTQFADVISDSQRKRLYAIYKNAGVTDDQMKDYLFREFGIESSTAIKKSDYETICNWASAANESGVNG